MFWSLIRRLQCRWRGHRWMVTLNYYRVICINCEMLKYYHEVRGQ